jgi:hypothetical protein
MAARTTKSVSGKRNVSKTVSPSKKRTVSRGRKAGAEKRMAELSPKRKRQYQHILDSERKEGRSTKSAKRIAMATTNKTRKNKGETPSEKKNSK